MLSSMEFCSNITDDIPEQSWNAPFPMVDTKEGIVIVLNLEQDWKANCPIVFRLVSETFIFMDAKLEQFLNV